ncbi:MAG: BMC domain-containing protein [Epulopiscium sp.]|nr:BMC domain-containing protein [Candidatus Epulonipiscium sp.]
MSKAIGLVEYRSVAIGMKAADEMVKTAEVDIITAQTVCPGKYIVLVSGKLSAVTAVVEVGTAHYDEYVVDHFILGNPDASIFSALYGTTETGKPEALGIIETYSVAAIIKAADMAAKTSSINLIEIRIARGMSGKSYVLFSGELAAVEASIKKACKEIKDEGFLLNHSVIPNPDPKFWQTIC